MRGEVTSGTVGVEGTAGLVCEDGVVVAGGYVVGGQVPALRYAERARRREAGCDAEVGGAGEVARCCEG